MKKILKILASLLGLLLVVFLLAGLIFPTVNYETSVTVNKPLDEVWTKYNDLDQLSNWIPEVTSIKTIKETPDKVGSEYEMVVENQGKSLTMIETVTEYKVNERVGLSFDAGSMIKNSMATFISDGSSTTITGTQSCQGSTYIQKCMFAFFKSMFKKMDQQYLDQFKEWVEGG